MKPFNFFQIIGALLAALSFQASALPELQEREGIRKQAATQFLDRDFKALSRTAEDYRKPGRRTESGLWKLTMFYSGIENVPHGASSNNPLWESMERIAAEWSKAHPADPAPHILQARIIINRGWATRGGAPGNLVPPEKAQAFKEHLRRAEDLLQKHKATASVDPEWYTSMLSVAKGLDWEAEKFSSLLDEATRRHPYYYEIYFRALDYLLPRWHGSHEDIDALVQFAMTRTREQEGQGMYGRIYWYASQAEYGSRLFRDSRADWQKMKAGMNDVVQRYPDLWNIHNFARFACQAGDRETTRELMVKTMTGLIIPEAWKTEQGFDGYLDCFQWSSGEGPYPEYMRPDPEKLQFEAAPEVI